MGTLDLRYFNDTTQQWEAPLANGVDLDAVALLLEQHKQSDNPHGITKASVGLGDVDNTSDTDKPISTATQQALSNISGSVEQLDTKVTQHLDEKPTQLLTFNRDSSIAGQQTLTGFNDIPKSLTIYANRAETLITSTGHFDGENQITWNTKYNGNSSAYGGKIAEFIESEGDMAVATVSINSDKTVTLDWERIGNPSGNINLFVVAYYHGGVNV